MMTNQDDELEAGFDSVDQSNLCEYDRLAIRDLKAGIAYRRARERIVSDAYARLADCMDIEE
ncbi:MAG TPA: hypothetical protein VK832_04475 [Burkholderiaceae bacterium]|jgi:hypothetical protein|nr:hypothetical protein [Burkholderiaceae bacterium]